MTGCSVASFKRGYLIWLWLKVHDRIQNPFAEAAMEITLVFIIVLVMMPLGCSGFDS